MLCKENTTEPTSIQEPKAVCSCWHGLKQSSKASAPSEYGTGYLNIYSCNVMYASKGVHIAVSIASNEATGSNLGGLDISGKAAALISDSSPPAFCWRITPRPWLTGLATVPFHCLRAVHCADHVGSCVHSSIQRILQFKMQEHRTSFFHGRSQVIFP